VSTARCRAHCPSCERAGRPGCFSSDRAFDAHIVGGSHRSAELVPALRRVSGTCRLADAFYAQMASPHTPVHRLPAIAVTVYEHGADVDRMRARRRAGKLPSSGRPPAQTALAGSGEG
jgi:hypothetical protein